MFPGGAHQSKNMVVMVPLETIRGSKFNVTVT